MAVPPLPPPRASDRLKICFNHSVWNTTQIWVVMICVITMEFLCSFVTLKCHFMRKPALVMPQIVDCFLKISIFVVLVYPIQWRGQFWFGCQCWCLVMRSVSLVLSVPSWSHVVSSFTKRQRISRNSSKKRQKQIRNMILCDWVSTIPTLESG